MTMAEGWYPHEEDQNRLRFWDGSSWTDERRWDGAAWVELEAPAGETVEPPPFDMERVTLTIVDDDLEPIPPERLAPPPPAAPLASVDDVPVVDRPTVGPAAAVGGPDAAEPSGAAVPSGSAAPPADTPADELDSGSSRSIAAVPAPESGISSDRPTLLPPPAAAAAAAAGVAAAPLPPPPVQGAALPPPPDAGAPLPPPPDGTLPPPPGRRPGRVPGAVVFVIVAVLVAALAAGGTYLIVRDDGTGEDVVADQDVAESSSTTTTSTSTTTTSTTAPRSPSTLATPSTLPSNPTTPPTVPRTQSPSPAPAPPSGVSAPSDQWVVVLASVATSSGEPAAQQRLSEIRSFAPSAQILTSDQFASLRPGYRVIYLSGGYRTPESVLSTCSSFGLPVPDQCYGRYLSQNPADIDLIAD